MVVNQTGPREFRAIYDDEEVLHHVRYVTDDEGEEHLVSLLPLWENQHLRIQQAFGRKMILDESRPSKDNVLYVKAEYGSPRIQRLKQS
jgi:tRNA/tmRNA/rRNA uracil-C5-methylase (TrmA/RlmC/RlmD family)